MLRIILLSLLLSVSTALNGQVPQAFSYQAVVLDNEGQPITEQSVGVQIDILDETINGTLVYRETHTVTTNMNGIYSLSVGLGNPVSGDFSSIDWAGGDKFLSISQDVDGGTNYEFVGANQLLSVPYALVAGQAEAAPKVWAHTVLNNPNNVLEAYNEGASINFNINYEWIQGEPEDVFVEYTNMPPNTHLRKTFQGGNSGFVPFDNFTGVDTILDGLRLNNNRLVITDFSQGVPEGEYVIDITYRTATTVLTSIQYPIEVIDEMPNPGNDCLGSEAETAHTLIDISCPELETLLSPTLIIKSLNDNEIGMMFFENQLEYTQYNIDVQGDDCFYEPLSGFDFTVEDFLYEAGQVEIAVLEDTIEFTMDINIEDQSGQEPPTSIFCILTYTL